MTKSWDPLQGRLAQVYQGEDLIDSGAQQPGGIHSAATGPDERVAAAGCDECAVAAGRDERVSVARCG